MEIDNQFKQLNFPEIIKIGTLFMIKVLWKMKKKGLEQSLTFFFWTAMEAFFQTNSLMFAVCDLALSL